jgi:hypothetical protein
MLKVELYMVAFSGPREYGEATFGLGDLLGRLGLGLAALRW